MSFQRGFCDFAAVSWVNRRSLRYFFIQNKRPGRTVRQRHILTARIFPAQLGNRTLRGINFLIRAAAFHGNEHAAPPQQGQAILGQHRQCGHGPGPWPRQSSRAIACARLPLRAPWRIRLPRPAHCRHISKNRPGLARRLHQRQIQLRRNSFATMPGNPAPVPTSTIRPHTSGRAASSRLSMK